MSFILFNKPCNVIFVEYFFRVLTNSKLFEQIELGSSQWNTFRREKLMHHVFPNIPQTLRVEDLECIQESLGCRRLKLVGHEYLKHVGLELLILDEITWLVVLQLRDNVVSHLGLRGELQKVSHDVTDFSIVWKL